MIFYDLETLPDSLEAVSAEYNESGFIDAVGESHSETEEASSEIEFDTEVFNIDDSFFIEKYYPEGDLSSDSLLTVQAVSLGSRVNVSLPDNGNVYQCIINGVSRKVVFPSDVELSVVDGYLVNLNSSPVTGIVDSGVSVSNFNQYYLTVNPLLSSSSNSNAWRYGSYAYLTEFYEDSSYGSTRLSSTNTYAVVSVEKIPRTGWNLSGFELTVLALLCAIVFTRVVSIFGGKV